MVALQDVLLLFSSKNSPYIAFNAYGTQSKCCIVNLLPLRLIAPYTARIDANGEDNDGVTATYSNSVLRLVEGEGKRDVSHRDEMYRRYGLSLSPSTTLRALHAAMRTDRESLPLSHF